MHYPGRDTFKSTDVFRCDLHIFIIYNFTFRHENASSHGKGRQIYFKKQANLPGISMYFGTTCGFLVVPAAVCNFTCKLRRIYLRFRTYTTSGGLHVVYMPVTRGLPQIQVILPEKRMLFVLRTKGTSVFDLMQPHINLPVSPM